MEGLKKACGDTPEKAEKPFNVQSAAEFLGYSRGYIYQLVNAKRIPYHKPFNGKIYFFASELSEMINRAKCSANHEIADKADAILNRRKVKTKERSRLYP